MGINQLLVAVLFAPAVFVVDGCTLDGRGTSRSITYDGGQVTVDGCLGRDQSGTMVFSLVSVSGATDEQGSEGTGPAATRIGLSTSLGGPWIGTRVLELVPPPVNGDQYQGRVLRVTGVIEPEPATTGRVDQVKSARGVRFTRLHVQSLQPAEGECAVPARGK